MAIIFDSNVIIAKLELLHPTSHLIMPLTNFNRLADISNVLNEKEYAFFAAALLSAMDLSGGAEACAPWARRAGDEGLLHDQRAERAGRR